MFDRYLIEIDEIEAGLLIREGDSYAFHALAARFRAFDGARFADPWAAERALRRQGTRNARADGRRRGPTAEFGDPGSPRGRSVP